MKKVIFVLVLIWSITLSAQIKNDLDWKNMKPEQRRELIQKMTPEERMQMLKQFKEKMLIEDINIPPNKQEEFKKLYQEYQDSQRAIKEQFKIDFQTENISDEEAKKRLDQSFLVGQQLLENRKKYADKFLKILTPQQVLKLFQSEGKFRDKIFDKWKDRNNKPGAGHGRPPMVP